MAENTSRLLFTEQFRPKTLAQAVIVPRIRQELERGLNDHLLFYGKPGSGKTTLSRIMASCIPDPLYINASLERGIDVIRETVMEYVTSSSLMNGENQMKIVVLEECDNLTNDAWASLRALIEQCHKTTRFIANCNYIEKIPDPIQSRFNCIPIEPINREEEEYLLNGYIERVKQLLNACNASLKVMYTNDEEEYRKHEIHYTDADVAAFVKSKFPDMRSIIKKIQQLFVSGVTELSANALGSTFDCTELINVIFTPSHVNTIQNYQMLVANWSTKADDGILLLGQQLPDFIAKNCPEKIVKLPLIVITLSEYGAQLATAIDKFIVLLALIYKLQMILNS